MCQPAASQMALRVYKMSSSSSTAKMRVLSVPECSPEPWGSWQLWAFIVRLPPRGSFSPCGLLPLGLLPPTSPGRSAVLRRRRALKDCRQLHDDGRPPAGLAVHLQRAAVLLDDHLTGKAQAQPRAAFGGETGSKQLVHQLERDTWPLVDDFKAQGR